MKIIETEQLLKTEFLNINATQYEDTKGKDKYWVWAQRPNARKAVVICAIVDKGWVKESNDSFLERDLRLVVTREFRVPLGGYEYGFPAGLIDGDENILGAAKRELKEETGLDVSAFIRQSPFVFNSAGLTDESIAMIYVECNGELSKKGLEDSEEIETMLLSRKEVSELLEDETKMFGAKAWMVMENFVRHNEI